MEKILRANVSKLTADMMMSLFWDIFVLNLLKFSKAYSSYSYEGISRSGLAVKNRPNN